MTYILSLDQGTSSSRSIVFDREGAIVAQAQQEFTQHFPQSGWVEHDALEIWRTQLDTARKAMKSANIQAREISAIGITNQRETTVIWDRKTGQPIHPAIVWQDRRTEALCARLRAEQHNELIFERTGLRIDSYFAATKIRWILDHVPMAQERAERGELAFGTIDSWLMWNLSSGQHHCTDVSNASRTMLFNIRSNQWDDELLAMLNIPHALLPRVQPSSSYFFHTSAEHLDKAIPVHGVAGDQQAALFGQACFTAGMVKNTYGTGCFMLMHLGEKFTLSQNGLLTTSAAQSSATPEFALEGSVFIGGAVVQWLRDGLKAISASHEVEALAATVPDAGGVVLVPAFTGLGAPYWDPEARGSITGLSRGTTMAHIAYAALESIAFQSTALLRAMMLDASASQHPLIELRVDGGASENDTLMQLQADLLGIDVVRPGITETTALGAAYLAGLSCGLFKNKNELEAQWKTQRRFVPSISEDERNGRLRLWEHAVRKTCAV
ncbi:glycerol kinase GlpK [Paenalcaligenes niemegkensis]|uniref:glycerol kinase GlpK n=1 Tax=Paenalcaligenes niemegkensis TaxID=2895469 RepID=UPI001EE7F493|nr:glycerol kinase GlpK [Paenalcaligenes niemegkensis]MCQ9615966.1 glycerol kinase GlpK [Paenalcaligenes niemegkensis]